MSTKKTKSTIRADAAPPVQWHSLSGDAVLDQLETSTSGLSSGTAQARRMRYGANVIPRARQETVWSVLLRQINNPLIWVLLGSGLLAIAVDPDRELKSGLVILAVVIVNSLIGFFQEYRAGRAIEALREMVPEHVRGLRGGHPVNLQTRDLVPGDIVTLTAGDRVPADLRLICERGLLIDESALTGESVPVSKQPHPVAPDAVVAERSSMAYGGTLVTGGTATAVVVATGAATELGRISHMLRETTNLETPLTRGLAAIARYLTVAIVLLAAVMLAVGAWRTMLATGVPLEIALKDTAIFAIALAVGAIPEGLPAIMTIALAIGVQHMARRRAVVRLLPAVETLGSTTVICTDKTGTLTKNEMTVRALWTPEGEYTVTGVGYVPEGGFERDGAEVEALSREARQVLLAGALCSDASLRFVDRRWIISGDPTEAALVVAAEKSGLRVGYARRLQPRLDLVPFESERQFMATLTAGAEQRPPAVIIKGAPEVILRCCRTQAGGGRLDRDAILHRVEQLAIKGMRVLAIAAKVAPADHTTLSEEHVRDGFALLGLIGMIDPPRPEVLRAVQRCNEAGITVKMITGDHKATAEAIGAELLILGDAEAVCGADLIALDEESVRELVDATNVFARVAPEHKLALIGALQANGEIVAMTGDGVNDAPALKQANIGVAMGLAGTSVAKEAADIVLADDNFASIAAAVEEGRRVYDNLIKSLAFVLPTNFGLALIFVVAVVLFPFTEQTTATGASVVDLLLPMLPAQLLWINLVATIALALPLAFEAKEPSIMQRPPRRPTDPILDAFIIHRTILAGMLMTAGAIGLFWWEYSKARAVAASPQDLTGAIAIAQTLAVTTVIAFQIFYLLNCRSLRHSVFKIGLFSNRAVIPGVVALLVLQGLFIYAPFMHDVFGSAPLAWADLGWAVLVGATIVPVVSIEKLFRNRALRAARELPILKRRGPVGAAARQNRRAA